MAVDEVRIRLRRRLEEMLGMDEADLLLDRPPGGWGDLVTNETLDLRLETLEHRILATLHHELGLMRKEMVVQTWRFVAATAALLAAFSSIVTVAVRV